MKGCLGFDIKAVPKVFERRVEIFETICVKWSSMSGIFTSSDDGAHFRAREMGVISNYIAKFGGRMIK